MLEPSEPKTPLDEESAAQSARLRFWRVRSAYLPVCHCPFAAITAIVREKRFTVHRADPENRLVESTIG
jgi:hypothetical protein